jgi:diguanylate cyclase (GGDEF)-like protein/PAS domain S-box-containing protein
LDSMLLRTNILDSMYDGVYIVDRDRRILFWNKEAEKLTGYTRQEVEGRCCFDNLLIHVNPAGETLCQGMCPLAHTLEDGKRREAEVLFHHKMGHRVPVLVRVAPICNDKGEIVSAIEVFGENIPHIEARQRIRELERLAMLDELTGLPNRRYLNDQLEARFAEFERMGVPFGVLMIDIDRFKKVNDAHGHPVGDEVLKMVSRTMENNSRPYDLVGRWGGEEFLTIVPKADLDIMLGVAERYRVLISQSVIFRGNQPIQVTVSLGGALVRKDDTIEDLIERSDVKLYASKQNGRNRITLE